MSLLTCEHLTTFKKERGNNPYNVIHSLFIACESQIARNKKIKEGFCYNCKTRSHRLHVCLDCMVVGCFDKNHIQAHAKSSKHNIGIDITFGNIFCFICNDYMYDCELKALSTRQFNVFWQPNENEAKLYRECLAEGRIVHSQFLGLRGLVNLGQTCYMNCIVQVLTHNPLLRNYFLSDEHNVRTCLFKCDRETCLACQMDELFQEFYSGHSTPHIPYKLYMMWKKLIPLDGYAPQDAHEFFITMLEILHQHMKGQHEEEHCQCIIHRIYTGFLQSDILCQNCNNVRTKVEEFRDICLDLGATNGSGSGSEAISLNDCLQRYTQPEQIQSNCDSCQHFSSSSKQLTVKKLPVVISFHLKRLEYGKKITTFVSFPEYLDMTPFVSSIRGASSETNGEHHCNNINNNSDNNYCLFAVVNHSGNKEGGHYISFIKREQRWYKCDDDIIHLASLEDVLISEGYLLFYHKELLEYDMNSQEQE